MMRFFCLLCFSVFLLSAPQTIQANTFENVEIKVRHVAGSVYMLEGRGGNIGLSIGDDGVIMVDDQFAPLTKAIVAAIAEVSPEPIRFVVNTHLHPDHTGGNENLGKLGALIVAHDHVRTRLLNQTRNRKTGELGPGAPEEGLPIMTFSDTVTFHLNGETVRVIKVPPAHTDGDSIVFFTESNVLHMGDVYRTTTYPYIDVHHGGSFRGILDALSIALRLADEDTVIIPGHGKLSNKKEMEAWRRMLLTIANRVQRSITIGDSVVEALVRDPGMEFNDRWGAEQGLVTTRSFLTLLYHELSNL